jgi:hypothetical protein
MTISKSIKPLFFFFVLLLVFGCNKDKIALYISFSPSSKVFSVNESEFSVNCKVGSSEGLDELKVFVSTSQTAEHLDTSYTLAGKSTSLVYVFNRFSRFNAGDIVYARFVVSANDGSIVEDVLRFDIQSSADFTTYTNQSFFSANSTLFNAYSIENPSSVTFDMNNPSMSDLRELVNDTISDPSYISYRWYSPSGGLFVKANNINFNQVTPADVTVIYNNSFPTAFSDSLVVGDTYILFSPSNRYSLFRVSAIGNSGGAGHYTFDLRR